MKLQDLAAPQKTKQVAKVMESHFGKSVSFESISKRQAHDMLNRVRGLISEHRRQPEFHSSEQNPAYLKLVMMEQALASRLSEQDVVATTTTAPAGQTPQQAAAMKSAEMAKAKKQRDDRQKEINQQIADLNKEKAELNKPMPTMEAHSLRRRLKESEVQQAQVVLASQDMVDQVQKMIEQVTSMQFKDLPALVDQIKNEVGVDQAQQFNADATAALAGLTQNLQGSKGQLETALGVVTGQAPAVPGADMAPAELSVPDMGAEELPAPAPEEDEEEVSDLEVSLGRGKR
jgi:DNA anti-recombination protein RmuC